MPSKSSPAPAIQLDPHASIPLYQQLYRWLRDAILAGRYAPNARLPSTRALARDLHLARNTVDAAFAQLIAEGYLESKRGAGTFVAHTLPDEILHARSRPNVTPLPRPKDPQIPPLAFALAFNPHTPAFDAFPLKLWSLLITRNARKFPRRMMGYTAAAGLWELRVAIAEYLNTARAMTCTADQVLIVNVSQQALNLSAHVLLNTGDKVWMEDPGYFGARSALENNGAQLVPVPVDEEGMQGRVGMERAANARMAYVTPSFQFPLGFTMSLAQRLELLEWAQRNDAWILEDDYNSEYRYTERPLGALQGLDTNGRVIYLGTFSKVLFPALRLGYMVLPPALVEAFQQARFKSAIHAPLLEQMAVAEMMTEGHFVRHIRRMRTLYAERQASLIRASQKYLEGLLSVEPKSGGMHLMGRLPQGQNAIQASLRAKDLKIFAPPLTYSCIEPYPREGLLLGYAGVPERIMTKSVQQLAQALESLHS